MQHIDLQLSSYDYQLPIEQIALRPMENRADSRLLVYKKKTGEIFHKSFYDLPDLLPKDSLLVLNNSKVFPCRLTGKKPTGGAVEVFVLSLSQKENAYPCLLKSSGRKKVGDIIELPLKVKAEIVSKLDGSFLLKFDTDLPRYLDKVAAIPLPPYIRNGISDEKDDITYQTVYAKDIGSVAAPTAGLHFNKDVFSKLEVKGIQTAFVTLHVGQGTFLPVKDENILDHHMHIENYSIEKNDWKKINRHPKIFAVGTTSLRVLESIKQSEKEFFPEKAYETDIFLHPGKKIQSIEGMITNFHLPKSSLIMLVSTLIGREKTMELYELAIKEGYRFYSYGDAMLIL